MMDTVGSFCPTDSADSSSLLRNSEIVRKSDTAQFKSDAAQRLGITGEPV
jgi:hypothetical protein